MNVGAFEKAVKVDHQREWLPFGRSFRNRRSSSTDAGAGFSQPEDGAAAAVDATPSSAAAVVVAPFASVVVLPPLTAVVDALGLAEVVVVEDGESLDDPSEQAASMAAGSVTASASAAILGRWGNASVERLRRARLDAAWTTRDFAVELDMCPE